MNSVHDPLARGLPHSDVHGSKPARGSPWLFAACHVLHRLLVPRHPPNALRSLNILRLHLIQIQRSRAKSFSKQGANLTTSDERSSEAYPPCTGTIHQISVPSPLTTAPARNSSHCKFDPQNSSKKLHPMQASYPRGTDGSSQTAIPRRHTSEHSNSSNYGSRLTPLPRSDNPLPKPGSVFRVALATLKPIRAPRRTKTYSP